MAISGSYYLNAPTLSLATAVFTDSALTILAADGFYSDGSISREQVSGVLLPQTDCFCGTPCGAGINGRGGKGIYLIDLESGSTSGDVGAVIINFNVASVPDGIRAIYNSITYNKLSSPIYGVLQSNVANNFTVIGNIDGDCGLDGNTTSLTNLAEYLYDGTAFNTTGNVQSITVYAGDVNLTSTSPGNCVMVIPKTTALPSLINIEILGACLMTGWKIEISCPTLLEAQERSVVYESSSIPCDTALDETFYFVKVHTNNDTYVGLYDYVFDDAYGENPLPDGFYLISNVSSPNKVIEVVDGIVVAITNCI